MEDHDVVTSFGDNNASDSLKFKVKVKSQTISEGKSNVEIAVPLKYLSNFWRTLGMPLINCEMNLILVWSEKFFISAIANATIFAITDTKIYVLIVTPSTQYNRNLLKHLKLGFKQTTSWDKYQSKEAIQEQNQFLYFLINQVFSSLINFLCCWKE